VTESSVTCVAVTVDVKVTEDDVIKVADNDVIVVVLLSVS